MYRFGYMYLCFSESWASPVSGSGCTFYGLLSVHWNSYYHEDIQCKQMWLNNTAQLSIQQDNHIVGDSFMKRILTSTDLISAVSCLWQCLPAHRSPDWWMDPELLSPGLWMVQWTVQVFPVMCCCRTLSSAELWKDKQQVVSSTNVISFQNR